MSKLVDLTFGFLSLSEISGNDALLCLWCSSCRNICIEIVAPRWFATRIVNNKWVIYRRQRQRRFRVVNQFYFLFHLFYFIPSKKKKKKKLAHSTNEFNIKRFARDKRKIIELSIKYFFSHENFSIVQIIRNSKKVINPY